MENIDTEKTVNWTSKYDVYIKIGNVIPTIGATRIKQTF